MRAAKLGTQDSAKPNAYCSVYVNPQKREKTEIIPGNADPQWNQDICLSLASYVTSMLYILCGKIHELRVQFSFKVHLRQPFYKSVSPLSPIMLSVTDAKSFILSIAITLIRCWARESGDLWLFDCGCVGQ